VEFWFIGVSMETNEDFWVQYYDGSTWRTVATYASGSDFNNGVFYNTIVTISDSQYSFPTNARLRFLCDASGNTDDIYIDEIEFRGMSGTSAEGKAITLTEREPVVPTRISLSQNHPNPFNHATAIEFSLPVASEVEITITDVSGRRVATLVDDNLQPGLHCVEWNAGNLASGVYFCRMRAGNYVETKRMRLLK
jgi:hypothetical protein